jgi:hypothetical protein
MKKATVIGSLNAQLLPNGTVRTCLTVGDGAELRPMLAKNLDTAECDFTRSYGLSPAEAAAFRERIEREGSASIPAAL